MSSGGAHEEIVPHDTDGEGEAGAAGEKDWVDLGRVSAKAQKLAPTLLDHPGRQTRNVKRFVS